MFFSFETDVRQRAQEANDIQERFVCAETEIIDVWDCRLGWHGYSLLVKFRTRAHTIIQLSIIIVSVWGSEGPGKREDPGLIWTGHRLGANPDKIECSPTEILLGIQLGPQSGPVTHGEFCRFEPSYM